MSKQEDLAKAWREGWDARTASAHVDRPNDKPVNPYDVSKMYSLTASRWSYTAGRGRVAVFDAGSLPPEVTRPAQLIGKIVMIGRYSYYVEEAEVHGIHLSPGERYDLPFGLVCRPVLGEPEEEPK